MGVSARVASLLGILVSASSFMWVTQAEAVENPEGPSVEVQYTRITGALGAETPDTPDAESLEPANIGIPSLERDARQQNAALAREVESISAVGSELEETQARARNAQARVHELEEQTRTLEGELAVRQKTLASSRARYKESVRAAYTGEDLSGLMSFLGGVLGGEHVGTLVDARTAEVLFQGRESLQEYRDANRILENTTRQLAQKKADYEGAMKEQQTRTEELSRRKRELDESISRVRSNKARTGARLQRLRAEEKARILKTRPASGGDEVPRDRELRVARHDIVARPVQPISRERYERLYKESAKRYGFAGDWYILAAVGEVESNHGENMGPSSAGALGPMQFLPSTWKTSGVDGNGDGVANVMDPEDAIPAAAAYLKAGGAPQDWYAALYSYNHADWYVREVLSVAEGYRRLAQDDRVGPYT